MANETEGTSTSKDKELKQELFWFEWSKKLAGQANEARQGLRAARNHLVYLHEVHHLKNEKPEYCHIIAMIDRILSK